MNFLHIGNIYINVSMVTDFYYDSRKNETNIMIVGEEVYRKFSGDITLELIERIMYIGGKVDK